MPHLKYMKRWETSNIIKMFNRLTAQRRGLFIGSDQYRNQQLQQSVASIHHPESILINM